MALPYHQQEISSDQETSWLSTLLTQIHPVAAEMLYISSLLASEAIPEELFTQGAPAFEGPLQEIVHHPSILGRAIEDLLEYKLIDVHLSKHTLYVTPSVQRILHDSSPRPAVQHRCTQIINAMHHLLLPSTEDEFARAELFLPHIWHIATVSESWSLASVEVAEVFSWAARKLLAQENYNQAEQLLTRAQQIYEQLYGDEHPSVAIALDDLASVDKAQGRYRQAQSLLMHAYLIRLRSLGRDHPDTIFTFCNIGHVYALQGFLEDAESFYKQSLENCERVLGPEHPSTLLILDNMASLYVELANRVDADEDEEKQAESEFEDEDEEKQAESEFEDEDEEENAPPQTLLQHIDSLYGRVCNPSSIETAKVLHKLAFAYIGLQQWEQAELAYQRVIPAYEQTIGQTHPDTLACQEQFALLSLQRGRVDEAETSLKQVLQIREQTSGPDTPDVAASLNNLGQLYITQEKFEQAEDTLEQALAICINAFEETQSAIPIIQNNLIAAYLGQGKRGQAQPLLQRQQRMLEDQLRSEDSEELTNADIAVANDAR